MSRYSKPSNVSKLLSTFRGRRKDFRRDYPKTALAIKAIKTALNVERKYHQTSGTAFPIDNLAGTPLNVCISEVARGISDDQRIGDQFKSIYTGIRGELEFNPLAPYACTVRLMVISFKRAAGSNPNINSLFQGTVPWSFKNVDQVLNYTTLADRTYQLSSQDPVKYVKININKHIKHKFTGANATDFDSNALFLLAWSNDGVNPPYFSYQTRIRYVDN